MTWRVAFTGHRPGKLGGYGESELGNRVRNALRSTLIDLRRMAEHSKRHLTAMSGMALGVDQWAAEACVEYGIPFIAALPCRAQERTWPLEARKKYASLLEKASEVVYVTDGAYTLRCLDQRNKYMVDWCDEMIAVWDGSHSGTANCVKYAYRRDKPCTNLYPIIMGTLAL